MFRLIQYPLTVSVALGLPPRARGLHARRSVAASTKTAEPIRRTAFRNESRRRRSTPSRPSAIDFEDDHLTRNIVSARSIMTDTPSSSFGAPSGLNSRNASSSHLSYLRVPAPAPSVQFETSPLLGTAPSHQVPNVNGVASEMGEPATTASSVRSGYEGVGQGKPTGEASSPPSERRRGAQWLDANLMPKARATAPSRRKSIGKLVKQRSRYYIPVCFAGGSAGCGGSAEP
jgi:hypothetical protein